RSSARSAGSDACSRSPGCAGSSSSPTTCPPRGPPSATPTPRPPGRRLPGPVPPVPPKEKALLDLKLIRTETDRVERALARRGATDGLGELLDLDGRARALRAEVEATRAERARISKAVGEARR